MADANQLKIQARREEAAGEYARASELYRKALSAMQRGDSLPDPSLLVRVADLEYRLDDRGSALKYYKRAVEDYAEQGLITNAIAVCNKILRVYPECVECHRRLADLHMDVGLVAEARQNLLRYVEAADGEHSFREIVHALQSFLDRTPDQEVALKLASRLQAQDRTEEALHVVRTVWEERHRADADVEGLERKARELDPGADPDSWVAGDELETDVGDLLDDAPAEELDAGFEPGLDAPYSADDGTGAEEEEAEEEATEPAPAAPGGDAAAEDERATEREDTEPEPEPAPAARWRQLRRMRREEPEGPDPEVMAERLELVAAYRDRFTETTALRSPNGERGPGSPGGDRGGNRQDAERAETRAEAGRAATVDHDEQSREDGAMKHDDWGTTETADAGTESWQDRDFEDEGFPEEDFPEPRSGGGEVPSGGGGEDLGEEAELRRGLELVDELLEVQPDNLELRERRLRYARRLGDREILVESCLDLAELMAKEEKRRGARVLYRRVLELDPENQAAESGLARLDVGELEEKRQSGKRAGATDRAPAASTPEEQEARRELGMRLWTEFENSIREMPWLHAATQAYQSAGPESLPPLEAFEMLAHYLMARDRHRDAADVLVRALELSDAKDEELADILYYLGVAHQKIGEHPKAEEYFGRLSQVDPEFARVREELPDGPGA